MAKTYETTFGTKINNAATLVSHLKTYVDYAPLNPQDSITELEKLITDIRTVNNTEANKSQSFLLIADSRQQLIREDKESLTKLTTPIIAYIRALYGKDSKEASTINEQMNKIRGSKTSKAKANADEKTISTSQQSYASLTQAFADLIASLQAFSTAYNPPNEAIKLPKLQEKLAAIQQANTQVVSISAELTKARKERNELYATLKESALRIKEAIKSQYGTKSTEYGLIKGLKF
jgi:DNA repair exonuclease SbcCD ATPase subunit